MAHSQTAQYSAPFPRQGLAAMLSVSVLDIEVGTTLNITLQDRNRNETTADWANRVSFTAITGTGIHTKDVTGVKQMCRVKISLTGASPKTALVDFGNFVSWRPY